jgi:UDP-N-acetylmuramyl-tripeptide synthetase
MAPGGITIVNIDDPRGREILAGLECGAVTYGIESEDAHVRALDCRFSRSGIAYRIENDKTGPFEVSSGLGGKFNIYNSLAMAAFATARGIGPEVIAATLEKMKGVPGRFEKIEAGQAFQVVVDYAHSPDGLENVLAAAREVCEGRLIVVFGAGGDRDRAKRPLMGAAAARLADIAVVTSDNPRGEEPIEIIDQIVLGLEHQLTGLDMSRNFKYFVEVDRFAGIKKAIELAEPSDFVVIAGKGHETYQIFRDRTIHFDDREVACNILEETLKA